MMMRSLAHVCLLFTLSFGCVAQAGAQDSPAVNEYDSKAWKEFSSRDGGFSVLLPGTPVAHTQTSEYDGGKVEAHVFAWRGTYSGYGVTYFDVPRGGDGTKTASDFLAGGVDAVARQAGAQLLERKDVNLGEYPGQYYRVRAATGLVMLGKMFAVKNRLYMLNVSMTDKGAPDLILKSRERNAATFLDSFKLLPAGPAAKGAAAEGLPREQKEWDELVVGGCLEGADCESLKGQVVGGQLIEGRLTVGKAVRKAEAVYPPLARAARAQGAVAVQVVVDGEGKVIAASAVSGHPLLRAAAEKAARAWEFTPSLLDGRPVKVTGVISLNFVLR